MYTHEDPCVLTSPLLTLHHLIDLMNGGLLTYSMYTPLYTHWHVACSCMLREGLWHVRDPDQPGDHPIAGALHPGIQSMALDTICSSCWETMHISSTSRFPQHPALQPADLLLSLMLCLVEANEELANEFSMICRSLDISGSGGSLRGQFIFQHVHQCSSKPQHSHGNGASLAYRFEFRGQVHCVCVSVCIKYK